MNEDTAQIVKDIMAMGFAPHPTQPMFVKIKGDDMLAAAVEGITDAVYADSPAIAADVEPTYPQDHVPGMRVPKGGSSCSSCKYLADNGTDCMNKHFQEWHGSEKIPAPTDEYCSDWYEPKHDINAAQAPDNQGVLWHGIKLVGFSGPEQEGLTAMLSRVPPELLTNVKEIKSAEELNAKHGRFIPETQTILFNPSNFKLRQRFGKGFGWILHPELTTVHEVGHSVFQTLTPKQKQEWYDLSGWMQGTKTGQAPAYVEKRPGWDIGKAESWTHKEGVKFTRHYAERNPDEDFADCFAFAILGKGHQMAEGKKAFIDKLFTERVKSYPQTSIQSPSKPETILGATVLASMISYNITKAMQAGGQGSGCNPKAGVCGRHPGKDKDKAARAKRTYVPVTSEKIQIAKENEMKVAAAVGGDANWFKQINPPFDVIVQGKKIGIEVKTIFPGVKNDKITMHPESRERKFAEAKKLGLKHLYTVAIDERDGKVYYRDKLASFRLRHMIEVKSVKSLGKVIR